MTHLETPGLSDPSARTPQGGGMGLDDSVYQRLLRERIIFLGSVVEDQVANAICAQMLLLAAEDPEKDIFLYINSPGGSVSAGMAIYDTMQFVKNDVATVAMGLAASMGQFLLDDIAVKEELAVGEGELSEYIIRNAPRYGMSPDQFAQEIVQAGQVPAVVGEVVRAKALATVLEAAKVVDASGRVVDLNELTDEE